MARFRRRTRRRFGRKRKRSMSTRALALRSLHKVRRLAIRTRPEIKFHEVNINNSLSVNGTVDSVLAQSVNVIPKGTSRSERIGAKVRLSNLYWNFTLAWTDDTFHADQVAVRITLLWYPANDGYSTPSYTNIFDDVSTMSHYNLSNIHQYRRVFDRTYELKDLRRVVNRKLKIPMKKILKYNVSDALEQNALLLCVTYDEHTNEVPPDIQAPVLGSCGGR